MSVKFGLSKSNAFEKKWGGGKGNVLLDIFFWGGGGF